MGMGLLKFIVFVQLAIALAFFSGHVTIAQIEQTVADSERLVKTTCSYLSTSATSSAHR